jgi:hypothetical protein
MGEVVRGKKRAKAICPQRVEEGGLVCVSLLLIFSLSGEGCSSEAWMRCHLRGGGECEGGE